MNNNENMSLSEFIGRNTEPKTNNAESTRNDNFIPVDVESILPSRKPAEAAEDGNTLFADLDKAVDRTKANITRDMAAVVEKIEEEELDAQINDDVNPVDITAESGFNNPSYDDTYDSSSTPDGTDVYDEEDSVVLPPIRTITTPTVTEDSRDDDVAEDASDDKIIEELREQIRAKSKKKKIDFSRFKISTKPVSASKAMRMVTMPDRNIADWVLYSAKRAISLTGLSGPEIMRMNPESSGRNRVNTFKDKYRIVYNHIEDANKPDFESWLKSTRYSDLEHINFGLYMATFGGSNFINYQCPKCNKIFIEDVKFEDMVGYDNENTKNEVRRILNNDTTSASEDAEYEVDMVQISDSYVFALKNPSIWNVSIESASLSDQMLEKYKDLLDIITYIDNIYVIDIENETIDPIDTKFDPNDLTKSAARRATLYYDILNTLSSEDYYELRSHIFAIDEKSTKVSYIIPGCTCPACNTAIDSNKEVNSESLLFMRHQLAAIGTTSHT